MNIYEKRPCKTCISTPGIRLPGAWITITVRETGLNVLHAVSLPFSLFKLERKKASCYRDLSETYLGTGHDFGE